MIDEFQDTSPLQWHALQPWLASYAGAGGGMSGRAPLSVFIVGDPKQSIYRFRRAEPRVFAAASAFIAEALGGRRLACDHTRRNAPAVLSALNAVFASAQADDAYAGFRPHTTEVAAPGDGVWALPREPRPPRAARRDPMHHRFGATASPSPGTKISNAPMVASSSAESPPSGSKASGISPRPRNRIVVGPPGRDGSERRVRSS